MRRGLYAIRDIKAEDITSQTALMIFRHVNIAIRMFTDALQDKQTQIAQHPLDYELIQLGELTEDGRLIPIGRNENISKHDEEQCYPYELIVTGKTIMAALDQQRMPEPEPQLRAM